MNADRPIAWRQRPTDSPEHALLDHAIAAVAENLGTDPEKLWSMGLIEILSGHATRTPDALAVIGAAEHLTWSRLMARVVQIAKVIAARVPPRGAVALLLPDGPQALIGLLACVAAARVVLVLNPAHPAARNMTILKTAGAAAVLATDGPHGLPLPAGITVIPPDAVEEAHGLPASLRLEAPAFVIYTSGSTGVPKGIVLNQAMSIRWCLNVIGGFPRVDPKAPNRQLTTFALAAFSGLHAALSILISGGCTLMPESASPLPMMVAEQPNLLVALPSLVRSLMTSPEAPEAFAGVQVLRVGGEAALGSDIQDWYRRLPADCRIQTGYGQTEASVALWTLPRDFQEPGPVPIGPVRPGMDYAVLDENLQPVADGELGVLHVRSPFISLGEWESGRCMAGRMRTDPGDPAKRILSTGDLVRVRPDGMLGFGGRADRQVKVRGFRIEPAEIEAVVRQVPGIADAAIAARPGRAGTELLAFVVERTPGAATAALAHVRRALPSQMHPRRMIALPVLPRLPGGKIDQLTLLATANTEAATPIGRLKNKLLAHARRLFA